MSPFNVAPQYIFKENVKENMAESTVSRTLTKINERLNFGRKKYRHGIRVNESTTTFNTENDSWLEMLQEEILDGINYCVAQIVRDTREYYKEQNIIFSLHPEIYSSGDHVVTDDNDEILFIIKAFLDRDFAKYKQYKNPNTEYLFIILQNLIITLDTSIEKLNN